MPEPLTSDLSITVDGSALDDYATECLVLAYVEDSRALPDAFELRFRDADQVVVAGARLRIGCKVKLGVRTGEESATTWLVDGELTSLEVELDARGTWVVARGYDQSHRLQRGRVVAAYRDKTPRDIVGQVAGRTGLGVGEVSSSLVLPEVVQPNISDWEFLNRLAGDLGLILSVSDSRVSLSKPAKASGTATATLTMGETLIRCRAAVTASEHADEVQVRSWDPKTKKALVGKKPATTSVAASIGTTPKKTTADFTGTKTLTVTDAPWASGQSQLDALAESLADQVAGVFTEVEAVVRGDPALRSGTIIKLDNVGEVFAGTYVVTTARHVFDGEEGYQVWLTVSGGQDRTLLGLVRSNGGGARGTVPGLVPGIVTNAKDPEGLGRVKVKLPWMDDTFETTWARTLQQGGKSGGGLVIPEVNDEVLVGFEQGHVERPFVLGGLYNGVDKPATSDVSAVDGNSGSISRRSVASRSGHRLELFDASGGASGVRLRTADGKNDINLDQQNGGISIASDGTVAMESKGDTTIEVGGGLTINVRGELKIKAASIKLEASSSVEVKGATFAVDAQGQAELKSSGTVSVSGSLAELKGSGPTTISGMPVKIN